jgi:hypothetical protein
LNRCQRSRIGHRRGQASPQRTSRTTTTPSSSSRCGRRCTSPRQVWRRSGGSGGVREAEEQGADLLPLRRIPPTDLLPLLSLLFSVSRRPTSFPSSPSSPADFGHGQARWVELLRRRWSSCARPKIRRPGDAPPPVRCCHSSRVVAGAGEGLIFFFNYRLRLRPLLEICFFLRGVGISCAGCKSPMLLIFCTSLLESASR